PGEARRAVRRPGARRPRDPGQGAGPVRILFLAPYVPFPILHGGRNRTWGLIRCLARFATVRVLAAGDPRAAEAAESVERLRALGIALEVFSPTGPGPAEADA